MDSPKFAEWPDLSIDNQAWLLAKAALGGDAIISEIAERAQQIKEAIRSGELIVEEV